MSLSGAPTWASMYRMSWAWSEWLECPVLWMLENTTSPVGELVGPNMGGHCGWMASSVCLPAFLPSLIMVSVP